MARGGARQGTPGKGYGNRTDLQGVKVAPGQQYGQAGKLAAAQKAIPLPNTPPPAAPQGGPPAAMPQPTAPAVPGQVPFNRPTERPLEPVTAGLPVGAGPGPEAMQTPAPSPQQDMIGQQLRQMYAQNPNNDLLRLIELHDNGGR